MPLFHGKIKFSISTSHHSPKIKDGREKPRKGEKGRLFDGECGKQCIKDNTEDNYLRNVFDNIGKPKDLLFL